MDVSELRGSVLGDKSGQSDMLNISLSVARHRKYQHGSKLTQSPFKHSAVILVPNPRRWLNVWEESNRGRSLSEDDVPPARTSSGGPKLKECFMFG